MSDQSGLTGQSTCKESVLNLSTWFRSPPSVVGDKITPLSRYQKGIDLASLGGCKSQSYTTWASLPHSYVASFYTAFTTGSDAQTQTDNPGTAVFYDPLPSQKAGFRRTDQLALDAGRKFMIKGQTTPLTITQAIHKHILAPGSTACSATFSPMYIDHFVREAIELHSQCVAAETDKPLATDPAFSDLHSRTVQAFPWFGGRYPAVSTFGQQLITIPDDDSSIASIRRMFRQPTAPPTPDPATTTDTVGYSGAVYTLPVRSVDVSSNPTSYEPDASTCYSAMLLQFRARLTDTTQVGTLGSLVHGTNIRDGPSILSLAKGCLLGGGTVLEVAAPMRLACMAASIDVEVARTDSTPHRFIRGIKNLTYKSTTITSVKPPVSSIIAMALDTYAAFLAQEALSNIPAGFEATKADMTWTAIPVRSEMLGKRSLVPYIGCFLDSCFWAGSVNHLYEGTQTFCTPGMTDTKIEIRTMPAANSVSIPGQTKIILVLTDQHARVTANTIRVGVLDIPVWRQQVIVNIPNFSSIWEKFWSMDNPSILADISGAEREVSTRICIGCSSDLGKTLAANVYAAQNPGIMVKNNNAQAARNEVAYGAWKVNGFNNTVDQEPLDRRSTVKCLFANLGNEANWDSDAVARWMCGYNMATLSALHQGQTAIISTNENATFQPPVVTWSGQALSFYRSSMCIPSQDSRTRVCTYLNLYTTHSGTTGFSSNGGFPAWIHMLSQSLSLNCAHMLITNNISTKTWAGYDDHSDDNLRDAEMQALYRHIFSGSVLYTSLPTLYDSWTWDPLCISDYYTIDIADTDWMTYSPTSFPHLRQWQNKINGATIGSNSGEVYVRISGTTMRATPFDDSLMSKKLDVACTIDWEGYRTVIYNKSIGSGHTYGEWLEQEQYITLASSGANTRSDMSFLCSRAVTITQTNSGLGYQDDDKIYVLGSIHQAGIRDMNLIRVSDLSYPDPPTGIPKNCGSRITQLAGGTSTTQTPFQPLPDTATSTPEEDQAAADATMT